MTQVPAPSPVLVMVYGCDRCAGVAKRGASVEESY